VLDEWPFGLIFKQNHYLSLRIIDRLLNNKYKFNHYFKEQFTTPFAPGQWHDGSKDHPDVWYWKEGNITNDRDGSREFIYLHFMNFRSIRWMDPKYGDKSL
jgi:hypothetical protein